MCGIAGIYDPATPPNEALLRDMAATMVHRGPDEAGEVVRGPVGLAHRRLSIIDLSGGRQPMFNEDETLALVFNGEIYDFRSHRRDLEAKGHVFAGDTDSEVLLHLYEECGPAMVEKLNGMFAFAICDFEQNSLFVARDRLGQKPLYYSHVGERFAFASGPAALRELPWVDTTICPQAIHGYLTFLCIPTPLSIHQGVHRLQPGHFAMLKDGELTVSRYWRPRVDGQFAGSYGEAQEELRSLLRAAVKRRLVADVPLGLFLSGGMDSSLICALAQGELDRPAKTFSIGFADARYDERAFAQQVADHLGTEHDFREVNTDDFAELERIIDHYEEPFADSSLLPTALLSRFTREHVTVALSGDAADELFGGYYRYRLYHLCRRVDIVPKALRAGIRKLLLKALPPMAEERSLPGKARRVANPLDVGGLERYVRIVARLPEEARDDLYGERLRTASLVDAPEWLGRDFALDEDWDVDRIMELELLTYLNDDILVKVDRASMASSLEVRSPFLDPDVVAFACSLPYSFKQQGKRRKRILQDAFGTLLPREIFHRPKMGFGVPVARWLRGAWEEHARDALLGGRLTADGWFEEKGLLRLLTEHKQGSADHSYPIFCLIVLSLWLSHNGNP